MLEPSAATRKRPSPVLSACDSQSKMACVLPPVSPAPIMDDFDEMLRTGMIPPPSPATALFRPQVERQMKYVVVSGGVCSSLGKGVVTSSLGAMLRGHGFRVTAIKMDPYINIDAGLMSPYEHGEVFVLDDGGETDLDLGNYERMMYLSLKSDNNVTTGKVYNHVIQKERRGEYLGKTVQVVPHITGAMIEWLNRVAQISTDGSGLRPQICMIELGGTVGDIESMPFIEAVRQLKYSLPEHSLAWCHCSFVPNMSGQKTKPTQHSVKALLALGVQPDLIFCRSAEPLEEDTRKKIANQCNIQVGRILSCHDVANLFHIPAILADQHAIGLLNMILKLDELDVFELSQPSMRDRALRTLNDWRAFAKAADEAEVAKPVVIAFVGKYNKGGGDAYQSVVAALHHSSIAVKRKLVVTWIDAVDLEAGEGACAELLEKRNAAEAKLHEADGIFVPGGFGDRGIKGKALAAGFARRTKKPYLGVCLGMQVALIQFAREELGLSDATSEEFDKENESKNHILIFMPEISRDTMGGNMRLGSRWIEFNQPSASLVAALYGGAGRVMERHRHRYEFNVKYKEQMEGKGLIFSGQDESKERMDVIELPVNVHPFYLGVQYHPEYKSRPGRPSPPFFGFVAAASNPSEVSEVVAACRRQGPMPHWAPAGSTEHCL